MYVYVYICVFAFAYINKHVKYDTDKWLVGFCLFFVLSKTAVCYFWNWQMQMHMKMNSSLHTSSIEFTFALKGEHLNDENS